MLQIFLHYTQLIPRYFFDVTLSTQLCLLAFCFSLWLWRNAALWWVVLPKQKHLQHLETFLNRHRLHAVMDVLKKSSFSGKKAALWGLKMTEKGPQAVKETMSALLIQEKMRLATGIHFFTMVQVVLPLFNLSALFLNAAVILLHSHSNDSRIIFQLLTSQLLPSLITLALGFTISFFAAFAAKQLTWQVEKHLAHASMLCRLIASFAFCRERLTPMPQRINTLQQTGTIMGDVNFQEEVSQDTVSNAYFDSRDILSKTGLLDLKVF